jgi:hypothetical protein
VIFAHAVRMNAHPTDPVICIHAYRSTAPVGCAFMRTAHVNNVELTHA